MATVLIVDDIPIDRRILAAMLRSAGHRLLEASNGQEALNLVQSERPDLVIVDMFLPGMDGFEFVRRLRSDPPIAQTAVIFSTVDYRDLKTLAQAWGVSGILTKPSDRETVVNSVQTALGLNPPPPPLPLREWFDLEHRRWLADTLAQKVSALEAANRRLTAVMDIGQKLSTEQAPELLLERFCQAAREILGVKYAGVGLLEEGGQHLRYYLLQGLEAELGARIRPAAPDQGIFRRLLTEVRPLRLNNPQVSAQALGLPERHPPVNFFLGAPITRPGKVLGWLYVIDKLALEDFTEEDERLLMTLAGQLALSYENALLEEKIRREPAPSETGQPDSGPEPMIEAAEEEAAQPVLEGSLENFDIVGPEGNLLQAAPTALAAAEGEHPEPLGAKAIYLRVTRKHREMFRALAENTFQGREGKVEFETLGPEGEQHWFEMHAIPLRNERREVIAMVRVTRDISAQKLPDGGTKKETTRIILEGMCATDDRGVLISANPSFDHLHGYAPGELIGKHLSLVVEGSAEEIAGLLNAIKEHLQTQESWSGNFHSRRKDGSEFTSEVHVRALEMGGKTFYVFILTPVSQVSGSDQ